MYLWIALCFVAVGYSARVCPTDTTPSGRRFELGCVDPLPQPPGFDPQLPSQIGIKFFVYDALRSPMRGPPRQARRVEWNADLNARDGIFNRGDWVTFIIHGFLESSQNTTIQDLKNAVQRKEYTKVVLVDWAPGSFPDDTDIKRYPQAANNALMVGRVVGAFAKRMMSTYSIPPKNVHIIGHSLGAQIMGLATGWLKSHNLLIGRGTASDAASPLFGKGPSADNVRFMVAIHTSSLPPSGKLPDTLGVYDAFANVDLYPNMGKAPQPACEGSTADKDSIEYQFCSHKRGYYYLTDILNRCRPGCKLEGYRCQNADAAFNGQCPRENPVELCKYFRIIPAQARQGQVFTFNTDRDRVPVSCIRRGSY